MLPSLLAFVVAAAPVPTFLPDHVLVLRDQKAAHPDADAFRKDQVAILKSEAVRRAVLSRPGMKNLIPAEHRGDPRWFDDNLRVETNAPGEIHVWFRTHSPSVQRAILDAVHQAYLSECFNRDNPGLVNTWTIQKETFQRQVDLGEDRLKKLQAHFAQAQQQANPQVQEILEQLRHQNEEAQKHAQAQLEKIEAERATRLQSFTQQYRLQRTER